MEIADAYREAQRSFVELVETLDDAEWSTPVPCNPLWTVRDVLSHVAGVTNDIIEGNVDGAATDPWTANQVDRWRGAPVGEMIERWNAQIDDVAVALQTVGERRPPLDCHSHEHDVRHAVGRPGNRDSVLIRWMSSLFAEVSAGRSVVVRFDDQVETTIGGHGVPVTLSGVSRFDFVRSRLGRRSSSQVAAWDWSEPPTADLLAGWFLFGPSTIDIDEEHRR